MKKCGRRKHNQVMLKKCLSFTYVAFSMNESMCRHECCSYCCIASAPENSGVKAPFKDQLLESVTEDEGDDLWERIQWAQLEEPQL